jgi:hypothetical protein
MSQKNLADSGHELRVGSIVQDGRATATVSEIADPNSICPEIKLEYDSRGTEWFQANLFYYDDGIDSWALV